MNLADLQEHIYLTDDHDLGLHDRVPVPHCHFCQLDAEYLANNPPEPQPSSMSLRSILEHAYDIYSGPLAPEETRLETIVFALRWCFSAITCTLFGHVYEDPDSVISDAESGYEEITCSRCSHTFSCYH